MQSYSKPLTEEEKRHKAVIDRLKAERALVTQTPTAKAQQFMTSLARSFSNFFKTKEQIAAERTLARANSKERITKKIK